MLSKALAAAHVPPRFVWGADPRDVAEAVLAVALEAAAPEGFKVPDQVRGEEGFRAALQRHGAWHHCLHQLVHRLDNK